MDRGRDVLIDTLCCSLLPNVAFFIGDFDS